MSNAIDNPHLDKVVKGPWGEKWVTVPGHHRYEVNTLGEIWDNRYEKYVEGRVDSTGHVRVDLFNNTQTWSVYLYVLVAQMFMPNYSASLQTKHRDGDRTNNSISNLYQTGTPRPKPKEVEVMPSAVMKNANRYPSKPSPTPGKAREVAVYKDDKFVKIFKNVNTLAKSLGVVPSTVYQALDHPTRKCQGLSFETYYGEDGYAK